MPALREIATAAERLKAARAIALLLPDAPSIEAWGSAAAIALGLRGMGKTVSVFAARRGVPALGFGLGEAHDEPLREFILSFDLTRSPIRELRYERDENRLDIILSPVGGRLTREDVGFRSGALNYDLVLAIGVAHPEAALESIRNAPELLHERPVINLDSGSANRGYGEINLLPADGERITLPELAHELFIALGAEASETEAGSFLAALHAATRSFDPALATPHALRLAADLIERGGRISEPLLLTPPQTRFALDQLAARAVARSRFDPALGLLIALLAPDDFAKTAATEADVPAALERVSAFVARASVVALLARTRDAESIRVSVAAGDPELVSAIRSAGGTSPDGPLELARRFDSFAEAEAEVRRLLETAGAVE